MNDDATTEGLRTRKKRETRARVHRAAVELVFDVGLDGVTIEEIAARAAISTRTFFNYFPTKEAAVVGVDPGVADLLAAELAGRPLEEHPLESMRVILLARLHHLDDMRDLARKRSEVLNRVPALLNAASGVGTDVERRLTATLAERLGVAADSDPYPALTVGAALAALRATLATSRSTHRPTAEETFERCFELLAQGLRTS